jgi:hypothetical protein
VNVNRAGHVASTDATDEVVFDERTNRVFVTNMDDTTDLYLTLDGGAPVPAADDTYIVRPGVTREFSVPRGIRSVKIAAVDDIEVHVERP